MNESLLRFSCFTTQRSPLRFRNWSASKGRSGCISCKEAVMRSLLQPGGSRIHFRLAPTVMLSLTAAVFSSLPAGAQEVKLNEVLRSLFYAPQYVALRSGAFEQEGLRIVGPKTTWGMQATLTEIVSGNSNVALAGP